MSWKEWLLAILVTAILFTLFEPFYFIVLLLACLTTYLDQ